MNRCHHPVQTNDDFMMATIDSYLGNNSNDKM